MNTKKDSFEDKLKKTRKLYPQYIEYGKLPPQATSIEEGLLGALILMPHLTHKLPSWMNRDIFYKEENKEIYDAIDEMITTNIPIDPLSICETLRKKLKIEAVGGAYYISELTQGVGGVPESNILYWCRVLAERWMLREMIRIANDVQQEAFEEGTDPFYLMDQIINWINELDIRSEASVYFDQAYEETMNLIEDAREGNIPYYNMGFPKFNRLLKLAANRIILLAALEKQGKTKFITILIIKICKLNPNCAVKWYTYEMSEVDLQFQKIMHYTALTEDQLKSIDYEQTEGDKQLIAKSKTYFKDFDIEYETEVNNLNSIASDFVLFCKKRPEKECFLVIDNIGGIEVPNVKGRTEMDDAIAVKMLNLRTATKATIFLVHHLKKEAGFSGNLTTGYRPLPEHIRGSGRFKDFANMLILINYPKSFDDLIAREKARRPDLIEADGSHPIESLYIIDVARTRHGNPGMNWFQADLSINRFKEY